MGDRGPADLPRPADRLRAITLRVARQALERAGLLRLDWIADALATAEAGEPLPAFFADRHGRTAYERMRHVLDTRRYIAAVTSDEVPPRVFVNQFADAVGPGPQQSARDHCRCVGYSKRTRPVAVAFHGERQDTTSAGWLRMLELIDEAVDDGREVFRPLVEMTAGQRRDLITLPRSIGRLTKVRHLVLYGSNLVRIPPEIGRMSALERFDPYTSYRLHWFPYELTRCAALVGSTVSTRAIYGNFKHRPAFPALRATVRGDLTDLDPYVYGTEGVRTCSVCDQLVGDEIRQVWISLGAGTDVWPLLVNACSQACVDALPRPARNHVATPHRGGPGVVQPDARR